MRLSGKLFCRARTFLPRILLLLALATTGCHSDWSDELHGGYAFWSESRDQQAIVNASGHAVIPCAVRDYDSDRQFVVAYQEPVDSCWAADSAYAATPGPGFWIISIADGRVQGPLSETEYEQVRDRLGVEPSVSPR